MLTGWIFWLIILFASLGAGAFWMIYPTTAMVGLGLIGGAFSAVIVARDYIAPMLEPERYYNYNSDAETVIQEKETCVLALTIVDENGKQTTKQIHGLTSDEWYKLGCGVVAGGYRYTIRDLWDIFGSQTEGNRIYRLVTEILVDAKVLEKGNGVVVSENIGHQFFDGLANKDYKVLDLLPFQERV